MNTSLETVRKAIEFKNPEYIPCYQSIKDNPKTDVIALSRFVWRFLDRTPTAYTTEWGFVIRPNTAPGIGGYHVDHHPLEDWNDYHKYVFPDVRVTAAEIEADTKALLQKNPGDFRGRYLLGHLSAGPYLIIGMLRDEENFMMDLVAEKEKIYELFGRVMDYQIEIYKLLARLGAHGILIHEDWGSSRGLIMSPRSWREIFVPHYQRAKKAVNDLGMHFAIQVTGNIDAIVPDLIADKIVDILFYPELTVIGIEKLGKMVQGKLCVFTCTDWKTTGPSGTPDDVRTEMRSIVRNLWTKEGGLGFWLDTMSQFKPANREAQMKEYQRLRDYRG